jgi:hypothetical protein
MALFSRPESNAVLREISMLIFAVRNHLMISIIYRSSHRLTLSRLHCQRFSRRILVSDPSDASLEGAYCRINREIFIAIPTPMDILQLDMYVLLLESYERDTV